jgi:hypothetical protein|tara:strand:+ start:668 stop:898 length:231 start_codon:yes stop_codon:yes gene_type:complete
MVSMVTITILKKEYDLLKEDNPLDILRLKRKTVLEYLTQRISMLEEEVAEVSKAEEVLGKGMLFQPREVPYEQDDS